MDLSKLDNVVFYRGSHAFREEGMCVMEAVAWLAGEAHTDVPKCVPAEISRLAQRLNDCVFWNSDEERTDELKPLVPLMLAAEHSRHASVKRATIASMFASEIHTQGPSYQTRAYLDNVLVYLKTAAFADTTEDTALATRSAVDEAFWSWAYVSGDKPETLSPVIDLLRDLCEVRSQ